MLLIEKRGKKGMTLTKEGYNPRLIDEQISRYLKVFGALSIDGPKWTGKTWTSLNHANSVFYVQDPANGYSNRRLAALDPGSALEGVFPHAIDEWQVVPEIWDSVRFSVDSCQTRGMYILTGSAMPSEDKIMHSGAGRIAHITMRPMTLYESGDSQKKISLRSILNTGEIPFCKSKASVDDIINLLIRGGWPNNIEIAKEDAGLLPKSYLEALVRKDMNEIDGIERNQTKVRALIHSLARNNASLVSNKTLSDDTSFYPQAENSDLSQKGVADYLDALKRLYVLEEIPAWAPAIRAKIRLRVSPKRLLVDPSLAVAALDADAGILKSDLKTVGLLFEGLCLRDLHVFAQSYDASLYHYQDNSGLEVDAIIGLKGGEWAAFEIKLGADQIDKAANNLLRLRDKICAAGNKPPCLLGVIVGVGAISEIRKDSIAVIPIDCLAP